MTNFILALTYFIIIQNLQLGKYKLLMQKQKEKNKSYKKETLQKLKEDEKKCNEYRLKINGSTEFFSFHTTNVWHHLLVSG
jgi:hypothetical protein